MREIRMGTTKKFMILAGALVAGAFVWLLLLKPYDYVAVIEAKTAPGVIDQVLKTWSKSLENSEIQRVQGNRELQQLVVFNDSSFQYRWVTSRINDSIAEIRVGVNAHGQNGNPINPMLRLSNLLSETDFERRTKNTLIDFNEKLREHLKSFRVSIVGEPEVDPSYCAYVEIESEQAQKAMGMMRNYSLLGDVLLENDIELDGQPFIEIIEWNRPEDRIKYHFCYPIVRKDTLPTGGPVSFKEFKGGRAIKATYNGNYISSDRAWYFLIDYAEKNGIRVRETPVEVFFNNPNMGGDDLQWRADVYMPLAE